VQISGVPHDSCLTSHLSLKLSERNRLHESTITDLRMYKATMNLRSDLPMLLEEEEGLPVPEVPSERFLRSGSKIRGRENCVVKSALR